MTGIISPQIASLKANQRSLLVALFITSNFIFLPFQRATTKRPAPIIIPGSNPAMNKEPIDVSVIEPNITKVMLGGIITPIALAAAINAEENAEL